MRKFLCFAFSAAALSFASRALASEAGMPQLNPEFWLSQIFWLIIIFSALYLTIWKVFLPRITYSIENRKSKIVNDLNEAQKLKENAARWNTSHAQHVHDHEWDSAFGSDSESDSGDEEELSEPDEEEREED